MRTPCLGLIICLVLCLFGCGGGGSGDGGGCVAGTPSSLTYSTNWGSQSVGSQHISVLDANGIQVGTGILNKSDGSTIGFPGLSSGRHLVKALLYSSENAQGTVLGEVQSFVDVCAVTSFATQVGGAVNRVAVLPTAADVVSQHTTQFTVAALAVDGAAVFQAPGAFAWEVLGGIGTISPSGLFLATTPGSGSIRARLTSLGLLGAAAVNATPNSVTKSKWTILVYLNAANDLYSYSDPNVNQMESVAGNPDVRFIVQWKQASVLGFHPSFEGTRRYELKFDTTSSIISPIIQDMGDVDMGDPDTLHDFIRWAKANYPADHYCLVVWNHGSGWNRSGSRAVSYDDEKNTTIQTWELGQALGSETFDILAWDASLLQMMEVAYEVKDHAQYVVGSEESPPGEGYPYDTIFQPLAANANMVPLDVAKSFVDKTLAVSGYAGRKITQSVLDTSKFANLASAMTTVADDLIANFGALQAQIKAARDATQSYSLSTLRYYRDFRDFLTRLKAQAGIPAGVVANIDAALAAAGSAIVYEGHNANSAGSTGLAIDMSPGNRFSLWASDYANLKFAQDTHWDDFLAASPN